MSFTCADMERFYEWDMALSDKREALAAAYAAQRFENETARAFATEGFLRRLQLMEDCVARAMELFPPRIHWVHNRLAVREAAIYLQAFVVNVQGCTDNLAHMWVHEKGLTGGDGSATEHLLSLSSDSTWTRCLLIGCDRDPLHFSGA